MAGGGYDISQSTSESATQGFSKRLGNFTVGGSNKQAWVWPVVLLAAFGFVVLAWWKKGKS